MKYKELCSRIEEMFPNYIYESILLDDKTIIEERLFFNKISNNYGFNTFYVYLEQALEEEEIKDKNVCLGFAKIAYFTDLIRSTPSNIYSIIEKIKITEDYNKLPITKEENK